MVIIVKETIPGREKIAEVKMRNRDRGNSPDPVPVRGKISCIIAGLMLMAASIAAGEVLAGDDIRSADIPVVLADGSVTTRPWYIEVDGRKVAVVDTEEDAAQVVKGFIKKYSSPSGNVKSSHEGSGTEQSKVVPASTQSDQKDRTQNQKASSEVMDVELKENVSTGRLELENGDEPPEVLDRQQAEKKLETGDDGESFITVVVTEEVTEEKKIEHAQEYKADDSLCTGQSKVAEKGKDGEKEVRKKVVTENGRQISEEVIEEHVVKEPEKEVILTGTGGYAGTGGSSDAADTGVSRDESATYSQLRMPVGDVYVSSGFGTRWGRLHRGLDLALPQGSDIYAADSGTVYFAGNGGGYGNLVKIDHGNGMQTYYAHCSSLLVSSGQKVERGDRIALAGSTGNSTGPHLHFEVIINGKCIDPSELLGL